MVGYGIQHGEGLYRMNKFDTRKINQTRDVQCIYKIYVDADWKQIDDFSDLDDESEYENEINKEEVDKEEENTKEKDEKKCQHAYTMHSRNWKPHIIQHLLHLFMKMTWL